MIRIIQGYLLPGESYYNLKWMLLGEWLSDGYIMYAEAFDYTGPLAAFVYKSLDLLFGRTPVIFKVASTFLIILQAGIFNALLLKNKVFDENSYLPAFLYVILATSIPDFLTLSPQLISLTFILLALRNIFRRIDNQVTDELFLSSGLYVGIATMTYLPSSVFFLVFLFSLLLFTTAVPRRILLYFFGFLLVFILCWTYFYLFDSGSQFIDRFFIDGLFASVSNEITMRELVFVASPFAIVLSLSILKTISSARLTNFQQKVQQVIWIFLLGAIATFFLSREKSGIELYFVVPPTTYFFTHYFILLKKRISIALMPGLLIFGLLTYSIYINKNELTSQIVKKQNIKGEKILVLGERLEIYTDQTMNSPFFNDFSADKAIAGIDYYEEASRLQAILERTKPSIILDELAVMPRLIERYPYLGTHYLRQGEKEYYRINN